ncbi:EMC6-like membrane protein [Archaeoglobus sp.]
MAKKDRESKKKPQERKPEPVKEEKEYNLAREMKKTLTPIICGIIAGFLSFLATGEFRQRDAFGIIILVFLIYVQKFILPKMGVELEGKDWAGIAFLTFSSWYISWTILLNL